MPNLSKSTKFILAIAAQVLVILVIVIYKSAILASGTEVLLQLKPVDPRDMLRGDYVTVAYQISTVNNYNNYYNTGIKTPNCIDCLSSDKRSPDAIHDGDTVYVPLYRSGRFWVASGSVSKTEPVSNSDSQNNIFIQGKVVKGGQSSDGNNLNPSSYGQLTVVYGIEDYFVPEGKGRSLNLWSSSGDNYARVALSAKGKAALKQLYINDKPWP